MTTVPTLADVVRALDARYDPRWAESWDAVGLVCGDPSQSVSRILFAVDPTTAVVDEALNSGVDLIVTHHPLFLSGVTSVAATDPKGRSVHRLITAGVGLFAAHTNADVADPGVSDALALALGLSDLAPLAPMPAEPLDKIVTFVPVADADKVIDALATAGAGAIGDYDRCAWTVVGAGTFRPGEGAAPHIGVVGEVADVEETRVEMVLPRAARAAVVEALRSAHPYEEPAFDVYELAGWPSSRGLGRIGRLPEPTTLRAFAERVAAGLPMTASGIRVAGDPEALVQTVGVCGGAGDSMIGAARSSGADVFVTGDLKHHRAGDALEDGGLALIDATHFGTEWPWLVAAADLLATDLAQNGFTVETQVSTLVTDPWTLHVPSEGNVR